MTGKQNSKGFILVFLGMLSAFGPFVMDMYLPTLPAMSDFFQTTSSRVQLGLTTSMIGLAIGQLIFGPLSDKYGRRSPLLIAMALFLISTVGCIFSQNISQYLISISSGRTVRRTESPVSAHFYSEGTHSHPFRFLFSVS